MGQSVGTAGGLQQSAKQTEAELESLESRIRQLDALAADPEQLSRECDAQFARAGPNARGQLRRVELRRLLCHFARTLGSEELTWEELEARAISGTLEPTAPVATREEFFRCSLKTLHLVAAELRQRTGQLDRQLRLHYGRHLAQEAPTAAAPSQSGRASSSSSSASKSPRCDRHAEDRDSHPHSQSSSRRSSPAPRLHQAGFAFPAKGQGKGSQQEAPCAKGWEGTGTATSTNLGCSEAAASAASEPAAAAAAAAALLAGPTASEAGSRGIPSAGMRGMGTSERLAQAFEPDAPRVIPVFDPAPAPTTQQHVEVVRHKGWEDCQENQSSAFHPAGALGSMQDHLLRGEISHGKGGSDGVKGAGGIGGVGGAGGVGVGKGGCQPVKFQQVEALDGCLMAEALVMNSEGNFDRHEITWDGGVISMVDLTEEEPSAFSLSALWGGSRQSTTFDLSLLEVALFGEALLRSPLGSLLPELGPYEASPVDRTLALVFPENEALILIFDNSKVCADFHRATLAYCQLCG